MTYLSIPHTWNVDKLFHFLLTVGTILWGFFLLHFTVEYFVLRTACFCNELNLGCILFPKILLNWPHLSLLFNLLALVWMYFFLKRMCKVVFFFGNEIKYVLVLCSVLLFVSYSCLLHCGQTKWCPAPDCGNAVEFEFGSSVYDVKCLCSYAFCWNVSTQLSDLQLLYNDPLLLWRKKWPSYRWNIY